ncbi:MAG: PilZ domain-containing protein [Lachnospiraceae bacterium]
MDEHRRSKRLKANLELNVSNLFKQNHVTVGPLTAPITVVDISKHGIGFHSKDIIPLDYYFNAALQLGDAEDKLYCVVKIIRCIPLENDEYLYGCEFVGMASVLTYIIDDYAKSLEEAD